MLKLKSLSLKTDFVLANWIDPDEIPHYAARLLPKYPLWVHGL